MPVAAYVLVVEWRVCEPVTPVLREVVVGNSDAAVDRSQHVLEKENPHPVPREKERPRVDRHTIFDMIVGEILKHGFRFLVLA